MARLHASKGMDGIERWNDEEDSWRMTTKRDGQERSVWGCKEKERISE